MRENVQRGEWDAATLIARVMRSHRRQDSLARPLLRFLKYGGEFATDLVQRMMATTADIADLGIDIARQSSAELAEDNGLPKHLTAALLDNPVSVRVPRRQLPQRPQVHIDPYSCDGPFITLPAVASSGNWLLRGSLVRAFPTRRHDTQDIPLNPSRGWSVTLQREESDEIDVETQFLGLDDVHAYIFEPTGRLSRQQHRLHSPHTLILAAPDVRLTVADGSIPPFSQGLPPRAGAWQDWQLWRIDTGQISAVMLQGPALMTSPPKRRKSALFDRIDIAADVDAGALAEPIRLTLPQLSPSPSLTTQPVHGVTGPDGCDVYSVAPCLAHPEGSAHSRMRWRNDNEVGPVSTSRLVDLPQGDLGLDLSPRLPRHATFSGVVEIIGALGSDLRERIAVVRGLRVQIPNRVIGPEEVVRIEISAHCPLTTHDRKTGTTVEITFEAGCESLPLVAQDMPLIVTIPRAMWAIRRNDGSLPELGIESQRIGSDEIESDNVESLAVRCGRPANVALELRGPGTHQVEGPLRAAGDEGRWAFSLSRFRTSVSASLTPRLEFVLQVDGVSVVVAEIVASYIVSELQLDTDIDSETREALVLAQWRHNRRFSSRQIRLWPQHRPWASPVVADIADDIEGEFAAVLSTPPGPYIAEIAITDEWTAPVRPVAGERGAVLTQIGTPGESHAHLAALDPSVPIEALELAVSGRARVWQLDAGCAARATDELRRSIVAASSTDALESVLPDLLQLALSADGLLPAMVADAGTEAWSPAVLSEVALAVLLQDPNRHETVALSKLERLWNIAPAIAAVFDNVLDSESTDRWERFAGWVPEPGGLPLDEPIVPVSAPLDQLEPERLRRLKEALPPVGSLPLQFGGYADAAFEMLENTWQDRDQLNRWLSAHHRITSYLQRLGENKQRQIQLLGPSDGSPGWHKYPAGVLSAAFHLTDPFANKDELQSAARALRDATKLTPLLATRSLLIAAAQRVADRASEGA